MTTDKDITLADLAAGGACVPETARFKEHFGNGGALTKERALSVAQDFDWLFASRNLLTAKQEQFFKLRMMLYFRGLARVSDPDQKKRRQAMALAFYEAYNSPEE